MGMRLNLVMEDTTFEAERNMETDRWACKVTIEGQTKELQMTDKQIASCTALALGVDSLDNVSELYKNAEEVFDGVDPKFRLMP